MNTFLADSDFHAENVADALQEYNSLASKFSAEDHNFTWEDGVKLHEAYEALQEARRAQARATPAGWDSVDGGVDNPV